MKMFNKMKLNRKGSAEIVSVVILVVIAGILALTVANGNSDAVLNANKSAQEAISLIP